MKDIIRGLLANQSVDIRGICNIPYRLLPPNP